MKGNPATVGPCQENPVRRRENRGPATATAQGPEAGKITAEVISPEKLISVATRGFAEGSTTRVEGLRASPLGPGRVTIRGDPLP